MSEQDQKPTPETDALALEMNVQGLREWTVMNHARRLERERDEAIALCAWLSKYQEELNDLRYELMGLSEHDCKEAVVMKWPVVQGSSNQIALKRISEIKFDVNHVMSALMRYRFKITQDAK